MKSSVKKEFNGESIDIDPEIRQMSGALAEIGSLYDTSSDDDEVQGQDEETIDTSNPKRKLAAIYKLPKRICRNFTDEQEVASCKSNEASPLTALPEKRLPLPSELIKMFQEKTNDALITADDMDHQGRVRSFPHERGNWATYVYVQFDSETFCGDLVQQLLMATPELVRVNDFHISLSKTIVLRHHWIQPFIQSLKNKLQHFKRFFLTFQSLKFYTNEEKTRTFLGLQVDGGNLQLREIVKETDECLREFRLSTFYEEPSFHVSIGWCVGNREQELTRNLAVLQEKLHEYYNAECCQPTRVENIKCKTGNKIFQFPLLH